MKSPRLALRISAAILASMLLLTVGCTNLAVSPATTPVTTRNTTNTIGQQVNIQIDGSQRFQSIDGFGVNINGSSWNNGKLISALDLLSNTMGVTIFRVILETADWESTNDNADPQTFNWDYYKPIYESAKFQSLWNIIRYLERNPKNTVLLNIMGWTPEWIGDKAISENKEDEWIEMIASVVYYGRNIEHLDIRLLSPTNEIDFGYPEGPGVGPEQHARLLKKLLLRLKALDLIDIRLVAPDTADVQKAPAYVEQMMVDSLIRDNMAHFSFHSYSGDSGPVQSLTNEAAPDQGYWMTEFSQWCQGCDVGSQVSDQWSFATDTTDYLFNFLEQGATAGLIYDGFDTFYFHHRAFGYWGVLAYDNEAESYLPRKRFYTGAQVFRFVRPGMLRLQASTNHPSVNALAFMDSKTNALTIVGHNATRSTITLSGALNNAQITGALALYQTTMSVNLERGADVPIAANTFSAQIAPDSIFTLTTY
jgi:O-glycosyl hydrolase